MNLLLGMQRRQLLSGVVCLTRWTNLRPTWHQSGISTWQMRFTVETMQKVNYELFSKYHTSQMWGSCRTAAHCCSCGGCWLYWLWSDTGGLVDCMSRAHTYICFLCVHQNASIQFTNGSKNLSIAFDMQMSLEVYKIWNDIVSPCIASGMWLLHHLYDLSWH